MTLLYDAIEDKKVDIRNLEKYLLRGSLSSEDHQKFLKQLPDDAGNAIWVSIDSLTGEEEK